MLGGKGRSSNFFIYLNTQTNNGPFCLNIMGSCNLSPSQVSLIRVVIT